MALQVLPWSPPFVSHLYLRRVTYPRCVVIASRQGIAAVTSIPGTSISDGPDDIDVGTNPAAVTAIPPRFMVRGFSKVIAGEIRAWRSCDLLMQGVTGGTDQTSGECSLG